MKNDKNNNALACPCGSGNAYKDCCQPYVELVKPAPTAEALMRSRYCGFVLLNEDYLRYSWHPDTTPKTIHLHEEIHWLGLDIKNTEDGLPDDDNGHVEFVARYKTNGKATRLYENSRFTRYENRWVYLDADTKDNHENA